MDSLNMKYKDFSDYIEKLRLLSHDSFLEWFNKEENKTWLYTNYQNMLKENSHTFSYYNLKTLRFLTALFDNVRCIGCYKTFGFGVHNLYCDPCIESKKCIKARECEFKTGTSHAPTCPHHNSIVDTIRGDCWNYELNFPIRPENVTKCSHTYYWMNCPQCTHILHISLCDFNSSRLTQGCKHCTNSISCEDEKCNLCTDISFAGSNKAHLYSDLNEISAKLTPRYSKDPRYFNCDTCPHIFLSAPCIVTRSFNSGCPFCYGDALCENDCDFCLKNSFAGDDKVYMYSSVNTISARMTRRSSNKYRYFDCTTCLHRFYITVNHMSMSSLNGCGYCNGSALCENDCKFCFEKSFASGDKIHLYSDTNEISARMTCKFSGEQRFFNCDKCFHIYDCRVIHVTNSSGNNCRYCTSYALCDNDCEFCRKKSFASHPKSCFWMKCNEKTARQVCRCSGIAGWFFCDECKIPFLRAPHDVYYGLWCGCLQNKTEKYLLKFLIESYPDEIIDYQFKPEWIRSPITNCLYAFDLFFNRFMIELDGEQHTSEKQIMNWTNPIMTRKKDIFKMVQAVQRGYSFLRIYQPIIARDYNYWRSTVIRVLNEFMKDPTPRVYYIENEQLTVNHYKNHQKMFKEYINKDMSVQDWKDFLSSEDE